VTTVQNIRSMAKRADKLLSELKAEYDKCLQEKDISSEAINITHEIIEKCSNALDQIMHTAWSIRVAPKLSNLPKRGGYFPTARDEQSYRSSLGQWNATDLDVIDPEFGRILRECQPMTDSKNEWLADLRDLANKKHTGLVPQKRFEDRVTTVQRRGGGISWSSGVTFSPGIQILGVPIDPHTQLPMAMPGVQTKVEIWVTFMLEGTSLNALAFCQSVIAGTKELIDTFSSRLSLA
jgi:hypothetical protein